MEGGSRGHKNTDIGVLSREQDQGLVKEMPSPLAWVLPVCAQENLKLPPISFIL